MKGAGSRNAGLKDKYRCYLMDALVVCKDKISNDHLEGSIISSTFPFRGLTNDLPLSISIARLQNELSSLNSYRECISLLENDPRIAKYLNRLVSISPSGSARQTPNDFLGRLLLDYLKTVPSSEFREEEFDKLYSLQESYLYSEEISCVSLTALVNFEADFDSLEVERGLTIRKISETERIMTSPQQGSIYGFDLITATHAIEQAYVVPKILESNRAELQTRLSEQIESLLVTLRLFSPGNFGTKGTITYENQWSPHGGMSLTYPSFQLFYMGRKFSLRNSDLQPFKAFYSEFKSVGKGDLSLAIRRFNIYYDRRQDADRLIDSIIAFENLLLPERDELSLRLAIRAANLLGQTVEEKKTLFATFRKAYDVRSDIIHGSKYATPIKVDENLSVSLGELVERLEGYLRRSIIELFRLLKNKSKEDIISRLTPPFS